MTFTVQCRTAEHAAIVLLGSNAADISGGMLSFGTATLGTFVSIVLGDLFWLFTTHTAHLFG